MAKPYDFYADMYQTHTEIGYLLWVTVALLVFDLVLGVLLAWWPRPDVYLVPGIDRYAQVSVHWGVPPPCLGEAASVRTARTPLALPDIPLLADSTSAAAVDDAGFGSSTSTSAGALP